jgi:hypothetical protein
MEVAGRGQEEISRSGRALVTPGGSVDNPCVQYLPRVTNLTRVCVIKGMREGFAHFVEQNQPGFRIFFYSWNHLRIG